MLLSDKLSIYDQALLVSARDGESKLVSELLKNGADISVVDLQGRTPLHFSASNGQFETTKLLVERGADLLLRDKSGSMPVHLAAEAGHSELISFLQGRMILGRFVRSGTIDPKHQR